MTETFPTRQLILLLAVGIGSGCAGDSKSEDVEIDIVHVEPSRRIGTQDGPEETLLGDVTSVAADPQGRIYVSDALGSNVRVFGRAGEFLAYIGKGGEGPGEFSSPYDLVTAETGLLFVRDLNRVTAFAPRAVGELPDSVLWTARIPGYGIPWSRRGGTDGRRYFYPTESDDGFIYIVVDSTGFQGDTIRVPDAATMSAHRIAFVRMPNGVDGFMMPSLARAPFEPAAEWDITPGATVVFTDGASYKLAEVDSTGDTIRSWTGPRNRRVVSARARADSTRALEARIDSLPIPIREVRNASPWLVDGILPDSLPGALAVHVSPEQNVWVRQWPGEGDAGKTVFDVFSQDGSYLRTVVVPAELEADPPPYVSDPMVVGVVVDSITDVEFVLVFTGSSGDVRSIGHGAGAASRSFLILATGGFWRGPSER